MKYRLSTPATSCSVCWLGLSWTDQASRRNLASSSDSTELLPARRYIPSDRLPVIYTDIDLKTEFDNKTSSIKGIFKN